MGMANMEMGWAVSCACAHATCVEPFKKIAFTFTTARVLGFPSVFGSITFHIAFTDADTRFCESDVKPFWPLRAHGTCANLNK